MTVWLFGHVHLMRITKILQINLEKYQVNSVTNGIIESNWWKPTAVYSDFLTCETALTYLWSSGRQPNSKSEFLTGEFDGTSLELPRSQVHTLRLRAWVIFEWFRNWMWVKSIMDSWRRTDWFRKLNSFVHSCIIRFTSRGSP